VAHVELLPGIQVMASLLGIANNPTKTEKHPLKLKHESIRKQLLENAIKISLPFQALIYVRLDFLHLLQPKQ
jgi:hypothetical protein